MGADAFIHLREIDIVYEESAPIGLHPEAELDATTIKIGERVAELIEDGDCLQMGIGSIPI